MGGARPRARRWLSIAVGLMPIHASGEGACIAAAVEIKSGPPNGELAFLEKAPHHLHLPLTLALWTGQREGDLLNSPGRPMTALIFG